MRFVSDDIGCGDAYMGLRAYGTIVSVGVVVGSGVAAGEVAVSVGDAVGSAVGDTVSVGVAVGVVVGNGVGETGVTDGGNGVFVGGAAVGGNNSGCVAVGIMIGNFGSFVAVGSGTYGGKVGPASTLDTITTMGWGVAVCNTTLFGVSVTALAVAPGRGSVVREYALEPVTPVPVGCT